MTVKDDLAALVADLDEATAAEVLAYAKWLQAEEQMRVPLEDLTTMWQRERVDDRRRA